MDKAARDNRSNQLNPNNDAYHNSRAHSVLDDGDFCAPSRPSSVYVRASSAGSGAGLAEYLARQFPCFRFTVLATGSNAGVHVGDCEEWSLMGHSVQRAASGYANSEGLASVHLVFGLR